MAPTDEGDEFGGYEDDTGAAYELLSLPPSDIESEFQFALTIAEILFGQEAEDDT